MTSSLGEGRHLVFTRRGLQSRANTAVLNTLIEMGKDGRELRIASASFSLDALLLIADTIAEYDRVRILFGDDANAEQRRRLMELLRQRSDKDLLLQREKSSILTPLKKIEALFAAGKVEARCYTSKKFHAKAYLVDRTIATPYRLGVIGSNFTRPGLTQNIELNVSLSIDQTEQLAERYEERWAEAKDDVVTANVLALDAYRRMEAVCPV